ncbi:hypothetical protein [Streptomyces sp. NPDC093990]|uniref:hypothetical protein n=1 Tax=Streptomyces sp. NPDC093990 TaxID=3155306 RepID=UPI0034145420
MEQYVVRAHVTLLQSALVLAGMSVNVWNVIDSVRALVESGASVADAALSDPARPVDSLLP